MPNGKGSLRRPLGQIDDQALAANWRRTFGTPMPPNKQVAVDRLIAAGADDEPQLTPEQRAEAFIAQERATLERYDRPVLDAERAEQLAHETHCECRACRPDLVLRPWGQAHIAFDPDPYTPPAGPHALCGGCDIPIGVEARFCGACLREDPEPTLTAAEMYPGRYRAGCAKCAGMGCDSCAAVALPDEHVEALIGHPTTPLAPVTPDVPNQAPVADDRASRRKQHRGR